MSKPVIHYAPYGPNAFGFFDCGAKASDADTFTGYPGYVTCDGCKRASPGLWPVEHPCSICGQSYPPRYLYDLKGCVPGGDKVTCLECKGRLEEREACAAVADMFRSEADERGKPLIGNTMSSREIEARELGSLVSANIAAAIRQRTTHKPMVERMLADSAVAEMGTLVDGVFGEATDATL